MHELLALMSNFKFYLLSPPGGIPFSHFFPPTLSSFFVSCCGKSLNQENELTVASIKLLALIIQH